MLPVPSFVLSLSNKCEYPNVVSFAKRTIPGLLHRARKVLTCLLRRKLQRHGVSMLISKQSHLTRVANKVSCYDGEGKLLQSWGAGKSSNFRFSGTVLVCLEVGTALRLTDL